MKSIYLGIILFVAFLLLSACSTNNPAPKPTQAVALSAAPTGTATPAPEPSATLAATTLPTPTPTALEASPKLEPGGTTTPEQPTAAPAQPTAATVNAPTPTAAAKTCTDMAAFYGDLTIPDGTFFRAGDEFTKTWRFRNDGDCTWTPDYQVVFYSGEVMNAPLSIPFPGTVAPGELVNVSIDMHAPTRGGSFTGQWEFADPAGTRFGTGKPANTPFWVTISVGFVDSQGVALPAPGANTPAAGTAGGNSSSTPGVGQAAVSADVPAGCNATDNPGFVAQVITLINQARQQNGLDALQENNQLDAAAAVHSADMACNNFLNHTGTDGSTWYDRIKIQGYVYNDAHENIFAADPGYGGTPQGAFNWWMNSPVHRDNILNPQVSEIGVGFYSDPQSDFKNYYTVDFAEPG